MLIQRQSELLFWFFLLQCDCFFCCRKAVTLSEWQGKLGKTSSLTSYSLTLAQLESFLFMKGSGFSFQSFSIKRGRSDFPAKRRYQLSSYYLTLSNAIFLWVFVAYVCVVYLHHFYQYSLCFTGRTYSYWN